MNTKLPVYKLAIGDNEDEDVDYIALVESPAIQRNFLAFNQQFVEPTKGETKDDFLPRCISYVINEGKDNEQAVAICNSLWEEHFAGQKVSFDYDDTLSTERGKTLAKQEIEKGNILYIISARQDKEGMLSVAADLGIPESKVFATGSNKAKVEKIKELGISKHYDNNADVIAELGTIGQKFAESYNDYPQSAKDNAARGIRLNDELGNKCATQVGKVRAQQIMNGENLSKETIKRTYSYLSRASAYYNPEDTQACGTISYLLWGGEPMLRWCESKMNKEDFSAGLSFAIQNEEQKIVSGPLMIADLPIYRNDEQGEYYVVFTAPEIKRIVQRFFKNGYQANVNLEHDTKVDGVYMFESFIIEREKGINPPKGYEDLPDGSWWGSFKVDNPAIWQEVKDGTFKGFSIEGMFKYELIPDKDQQTMNKIIEILEQIEH